MTVNKFCVTDSPVKIMSVPLTLHLIQPLLMFSFRNVDLGTSFIEICNITLQ